MRTSRHLKFLSAALAFVVGLGTLGFHYIEGWPWFDGFYMVITTLTTIRISGSPSPVAGRARVQRHYHPGWSRACVSGHRIPHPGFARIRAAELFWKAPHGT